MKRSGIEIRIYKLLPQRGQKLRMAIINKPQKMSFVAWFRLWFALKEYFKN